MSIHLWDPSVTRPNPRYSDAASSRRGGGCRSLATGPAAARHGRLADGFVETIEYVLRLLNPTEKKAVVECNADTQGHFR
jgi:hypothetical protein